MGATAFTITGTNLTGATSVTVNGVAATNVVASATSITAKTPAGTAGAKSVAVTTPGGTATKASAFTYVVPAPTIASVSPASGPTRGGTVVTITGTNLIGARVTVDGTDIPVYSNTGTSFKITTPAYYPGYITATLTTPYGSVTMENVFYYYSGFVGEAPSGDGNTNNGSGVSGTSSNDSNSSSGQTTSNNPNDGTAVEPIGIQLYLQTISQQTDAQVVCDDTGATTSVHANDTTSNAVAIDLDHNGVADICQLRAGDFDLNSVIDEHDMAILLGMIDTDPVLGIGDMDGNGKIDAGDISLLLLQMN